MARHFSEPLEPEDFFDQQEARQRRLNMAEVIEQNARIAEREAADEAKRQAEAAERMRAANGRRLLRDYHAAGVEPLQLNGDGTPTVSLSMLLKIGWTIFESPDGNALVAPQNNHHKPKRREDYEQGS